MYFRTRSVSEAYVRIFDSREMLTFRSESLIRDFEEISTPALARG